MGVSGAGKTTLLDVLAGRKTGGYTEGDIRIGGHTKVQETFVRILGYCEQVDIHSSQLTVEEAVTYSAWLRLPAQVDEKTRSVRPLAGSPSLGGGATAPPPTLLSSIPVWKYAELNGDWSRARPQTHGAFLRGDWAEGFSRSGRK